MAKAFSGKKPQHFGNTIRVFLNYLGRHKFMLGLVGVLTAVSALANLLGTYMIKPVVNGILETGSIPGLVRGVALTAAIYAVGALSTLATPRPWCAPRRRSCMISAGTCLPTCKRCPSPFLTPAATAN